MRTAFLARKAVLPVTEPVIVRFATAWVIPPWETETALSAQAATAENAAARVSGNAGLAAARANVTTAMAACVPPAAVKKLRLSSQ